MIHESQVAEPDITSSDDRPTTVLVGADICPIGANVEYFQRGDAEALFHDLLPEFDRADVVIANLECPLIDSPAPIKKTGPTFGADPSCIEAISKAGIHVLGLANNHIMDHGPSGLGSTMRICAEAGIATVGAGPDVGAARRILVRSVRGTRVGILAMAEHEFSIATATSAGANPLDLIDFVRNVTANRAVIDCLIVLLHGGPEFLSVPSPRLKDTCHFLVEMGANAVIVQHPHSFGGYEAYRGGHIVYGQGALVMDEAIYRDRKTFHEGMLVKLTFAATCCSMKLLPFTQSDPVPGAQLMKGDRAAAFRRALDSKSAAILNDNYVAEEWRRFCDERKHGYLNALFAHNRFLRRANRNGQLSRFLYPKRRLMGTRNVICCETHREALETLFKEGML